MDSWIARAGYVCNVCKVSVISSTTLGSCSVLGYQSAHSKCDNKHSWIMLQPQPVLSGQITYKFLRSVAPRNAFLGTAWRRFSLRSLRMKSSREEHISEGTGKDDGKVEGHLSMWISWWWSQWWLENTLHMFRGMTISLITLCVPVWTLALKRLCSLKCYYCIFNKYQPVKIAQQKALYRWASHRFCICSFRFYICAVIHRSGTPHLFLL